MPWVLTRGERRRRNRLQGGRLHLGTVADIKSERWPTSSRNRWPACVGIRILVATVAFYGPDNRRASKLAVGIVLAENEEAVELKRWFAEPGDVREDVRIAEEVLAYMDGFGVRSVAMVDRIIGCPHEEGIDYHGS